MEKGLWGTKILPLLGHVVKCKQGIEADPEKVHAMTTMKPTTYISDVRTFLGASGYLHRYMPEYSAFAGELRKLDDKSKSGAAEAQWSDSSLSAFALIKKALVSAPLLYFPDFSKPWIIACGSSNGQLGAVLCQLDQHGVERPIAYASTSLTDAQKRWGITCKEGLGHTIPCLSRRRESSSMNDFLDQSQSLDRSHLDQIESFFIFIHQQTNHHLSVMQSSAGESNSTSGSSSGPCTTYIIVTSAR